MARFAHAFGPDRPAQTYVEHAFRESTWDTGEVALNIPAVTGWSSVSVELPAGRLAALACTTFVARLNSFGLDIKVGYFFTKQVSNRSKDF